jgi:hypothetical protein
VDIRHQAPYRDGSPHHARFWGRKRRRAVKRSPKKTTEGSNGRHRGHESPNTAPRRAVSCVFAAEVAGEKRGKERGEKKKTCTSSFSASSRTPSLPSPGSSPTGEARGRREERGPQGKTPSSVFLIQKWPKKKGGNARATKNPISRAP